MFDAALSPQQQQVIDALSDGVSSTDAAAQAGVHRNTIANWRRNSLFFREALADAQYDRALLFRDQTERRLDRALETLDAVLSDPKASASVRLKAALFIIDRASTPPPPRKYPPVEISEVHQQIVHPVHNNAQTAQCPAPKPAPTPAPEAPTAENPPSVHNNAQNAQSPFRRETPKVGRNEPCPCGSGRKYKHCCLNQPQSDTRAAAA
jgi:transposase-like protein